MGSIVEHSIRLVCGTQAIARKDGIEIRRDNEAICVIRWPQIHHLRVLGGSQALTI